MTNEVEKKGEIYFKVRLSINSHPNWLPRLFDLFVVCWHWQLDRWWKISDLINDLAGLLYAGLEEVQGGGRGGVHQSYVQGGHRVKGSQLCWSNHFQCMCGTDPHPVGFRAKKYKVWCSKKSIKLYHPLTIQVDQRFIERKDFLEMMQVTSSIPLDCWMLLHLMPVVSVLVTFAKSFGQHKLPF